MQKKLGIMKRAAFALLCAAGCLGLLTATSAVFFFALGDSSAAEEREDEIPAEQAAAPPASSGSLVLEDGFVQSDDWRLVLVNFETPVPSGCEPELVAVGSVQVDKRIEEDLTAMMEAAAKEGLTITLSSGYRSTERQAELFQNAVEENVELGMNLEMAEAVAAESVARAEYSEHSTGLAVDLNGVLETFDETAEYRWLLRHAHEYGFVLRYPEDKADVTKIRFEPWHFRYVGAEHASKMRLLNLCLEEYLLYLDAQTGGS